MANLITTVIATVALLNGGEDVHRGEAYCLAKNIYHEARGEPLLDRIRVSAVTIQTARKKGTTVCGEVYRKAVSKRTGKLTARYSWTLDPRVRHRVDDMDCWRDAVEVAVLMLGGNDLGHDVHEATNFYSPSKVRPFWADAHQVVARGEGDFIFTKRRRN